MSYEIPVVEDRMCHPGAMDGTPSLQTWTYHPSNHLRLPDTSPRGKSFIAPLMHHHGPTTHPHVHSPEQWVRFDHKRDDLDQTLRRPSRKSSYLGSRCIPTAVDVPLQSTGQGLGTENNVRERIK